MRGRFTISIANDGEDSRSVYRHFIYPTNLFHALEGGGGGG